MSVKYCHQHTTARASYEQKFGACTFWTPVCRRCRNETPWHRTKPIRRPSTRSKT